MQNFSNDTYGKRNQEVPQSDINYLISAVIFFAIGTVLMSVFTLDITSTIKLIALIAGFIFCIIGAGKLITYIKQVQAFRNYKSEWDKSRGVYDRFAIELNQWYDKGISPRYCDGDTSYFLKLQNERLKEKGLQMTNRTFPVKGESFGTAKRTFSSSWYTADMIFENVKHQIEFRNSYSTVYKNNLEECMYQMIIHSPNERSIKNITMTCPNCGSNSYVSDLINGCKYCDTQFKINDLFPRIMNVFFINMPSIAKNKTTSKYGMGITMLIALAIFLPGNLMTYSSFLPLALIMSYIETAIIGGFLGVIVMDILLIFSNFNRGGMKHISIFTALTAKHKVKRVMSKFDRNFSYEKFEGQIVSLIRMAVFAKDPTNLVAYDAPKRDKSFEDIVEMSSPSGICLKKYSVKNNILHITLKTWWINYYEKNGHIHKKGDIITVTLRHNLAKQTPPGFSISSVSCKSCGRSFDAIRQRRCPNCNTPYHMEDEGFVIEELYK